MPCGLKTQPEGRLVSEWDYARDCTRCDAFRLVKNVIDFILIGIVPPVGAVLFIVGGLMILLGGANPNLIAKGKTLFWNTFIGLIIIFSAWLVANTFIKSFGPDQIKDSWFRFTCKAAVEKTEIIGPAGPGNICFRPQELARQNNAVYPRKNALELDQLISCVKSKLPGENLGSVYTFELSNTLCNYTRGAETCGKCAHAVNSCHYGGSNSAQGSLAVDFGNEDIGDKIIQAAYECGAKPGGARCEDAGGNKAACTDPLATHVHINSKSCDRN